jgi:hypothetical protein
MKKTFKDNSFSQTTTKINSNTKNEEKINKNNNKIKSNSKTKSNLFDSYKNIANELKKNFGSTLNLTKINKKENNENSIHNHTNYYCNYLNTEEGIMNNSKLKTFSSKQNSPKNNKKSKIKLNN